MVSLTLSHSRSVFSIMHISDLHRSPRDPIPNVTLIQSLLADRSNYTKYGVPAPDAIVVSGDLVWGAAIDTPDYRTVIRCQYTAALEFLSDLADRFLDGDRSRVVIAPGNHDGCWNTAKSAMRKVAHHDEPDNIHAELHSTSARYRWSWQDRSLYEIVDQELYRRRFDAYWDCVEHFYRDVDLPVPLCRKRHFNVFQLDGGRLVVVAFESQSHNDHLADYGYVSDASISKCDLLLRDAGLSPTLKIAVWHHGISGPPAASDYLDVGSVAKMIAVGFRLGLHGHQHYSDASTQHVHLPEIAEMAVVGAGSLCAGDSDLPHSVNRQYNLIVIGSAYDRADVHIREVISANQFGASRNPRFSPEGYICVKWERLKDAAGRPIDQQAANERSSISEAESALNEGHPDSAVEALAHLELGSGTYARALYIEAAQAAERAELLVPVLDPPDSADELVALVLALESSDEVTAALDALHRHQKRLSLSSAVVRDIEDRLEFRRMMKGARDP